MSDLYLCRLSSERDPKTLDSKQILRHQNINSTKMATLKARLAELGNETLLTSAETIYKTSIESTSLTLSNPRGIKEELQFLKEFCSKLKFQYLEQESRDKFLRELLMDGTREISPLDIDRITEENVELKLALKQLKNEMASIIEQSEKQAEEVIDLHKQFSARYEEVDRTLAGVDELQRELDELLQEPQNENHVALYNMKKLIDTDEIGLNEAIEIAESVVELEAQVLADLDKSLKGARKEYTEKEQLMESLQAQLVRLQAQLESEPLKSEQTIDPQQAYANWLRELNTTMQKFIPVPVAIERFGENSVLKFRDTKITLDKNLSVVATAPKLSSQAITEINCADQSSKFWKLSRLLSEIIFQ